MAPNKIDPQFKDQLESRTLQPSSHAWEKLSVQLDANQKNKKRVFLQWISVAAILIIALSVGGAFIFKTLQPAEMPVIVDSTTENESPSQVITSIQIKENTKPVEKEDNLQHGKSELVPSEEKQTMAPKSKTIQIAENKETSVHELQSYEDQKISEIVAALTEIQNDKNEVTEEQIDALLKSAQRDILLNKIYNEQTKKVDATALLAQVEGELNHSLRDRVIEVLKSSFITVKTAVADRKN